MHRQDPGLPTSEHFQLQRLAPGVFAAVLPDIMANIGATANAGIIDLGDATLVFDTFLTPPAADDLCAIAERLTGRPPDYVVNSHFHSDHIRGNQAFPARAAIVSTAKTRELIATRGAEDIEDDARASGPELQELEEQIVTEQDPRRRESLRLEAAEIRAVRDSLPALALRLPELTFDSRLTLHGSQRTAEVITLGGGHTESDAFLIVPAERIAFLGDLLFVGHHPYLADGDPRALDRTLAAIEHLGVETIVPGHGPVGTATDVRLMRRYLATLEELTQAVRGRGGSVDEAAAQVAPPPFDEWSFDFFLASNLRFLYEWSSSPHPTETGD
jgi:cyclase